jgi:IS4 transposase
LQLIIIVRFKTSAVTQIILRESTRSGGGLFEGPSDNAEFPHARKCLLDYTVGGDFAGSPRKFRGDRKDIRFLVQAMDRLDKGTLQHFQNLSFFPRELREFANHHSKRGLDIQRIHPLNRRKGIIEMRPVSIAYTS